MSDIKDLAGLIALIESSGNLYAVRFEPAYQPKDHCAIQMSTICKCSYATAKVLCAMSWGLYQIMGDNLINLGLNITPFEYLESPAIQREFFEAYCVADHLNMTLEDILSDAGKRMLFARLYNGPGNVAEYAQRIVDVAKSNGLEVN